MAHRMGGTKISKTIRIDAAIDQALKAAALRDRRSYIGELEWAVTQGLGLDGVALRAPVEVMTRRDAVSSWDRILVEIQESKRMGRPIDLSPRERSALRAVGGTARIGQTRPSQLIALRRSYTKAFLAWSGGTTDGQANT